MSRTACEGPPTRRSDRHRLLKFSQLKVRDASVNVIARICNPSGVFRTFDDGWVYGTCNERGGADTLKASEKVRTPARKGVSNGPPKQPHDLARSRLVAPRSL